MNIKNLLHELYLSNVLGLSNYLKLILSLYMLLYSVCMSVYHKDNPDDVYMSINSMLHQTIKPNEVVVVIDGPIPQSLSSVLEGFKAEEHIITIQLDENKGLGNALRIGVLVAKNELVARMDSDDIALADRCEKQLKCFEEDENLSVVGGSITEFIDRPGNVVASRVCPLSDMDIKLFMKKRCGFNHMTVMFKKSEVLKAGNYQDWHYNEDYYLWLRMIQQNCKFRNLKDVLVNVRVGNDMYARRGGWKYFKSEFLLQKYMWEQHILGGGRFFYNVMGRFIVEIVMTNRMRAFVFQSFLRK